MTHSNDKSAEEVLEEADKEVTDMRDEVMRVWDDCDHVASIVIGDDPGHGIADERPHMELRQAGDELVYMYDTAERRDYWTGDTDVEDTMMTAMRDDAHRLLDDYHEEPEIHTRGITL